MESNKTNVDFSNEQFVKTAINTIKETKTCFLKKFRINLMIESYSRLGMSS